LQGQGISEESQADADAAARRDLIKQIEVTISGEDVITYNESTPEEFSYAIRSTLVESINLHMSGLVIDRRAQRCGQFFAKASLRVHDARRQLTRTLETLTTEVARLSNRAQANATRGDIGGALSDWYAVRSKAITANEIAQRITHIDPTSDPPTLAIDPPQEAITTQLGNIHMTIVGGDGQRVICGRRIEQPLRVAITATHTGRTIPLPNFSVHFDFQTGHGTVDSNVRTDAKGHAVTQVHDLAHSQNTAIVTATLMLPSTVNAEDSSEASHHTVHFRITPSPTLLDAKIHELACHLMKQANTSVGTMSMVTTFTDLCSKKRHPLSARLEAAMKSGVMQLGIVRVREVPHAHITTTISGVYELLPDNNLWVQATLTSTAEDVTEGIVHTVIPHRTIRPDHLEGLQLQSCSTPSTTIIAPPTHTDTYDRWIEKQWAVKNPRGFQTTLIPEQPYYRVGEHARLQFRTSHDCYLTVISIGPTGTWTMLLPNAWRSIPPLIRATDHWTIIPAQEDGFDFTIASPIGTERVKAICTLHPTPLIENTDFTQGVFQLKRTTDQQFRDIRATATQIPATDWSASAATFITLDASKTETQGQRMLRKRGLTAP